MLAYHAPTPVSLDLPIATTIIGACSKCGEVTDSGKSSCCTPGGDWFGDCGGDGDFNGNYSHTWSEGIEACSDSHQMNAVQHQQTHEKHVYMDAIAIDAASRVSSSLTSLAILSVFLILL